MSRHRCHSGSLLAAVFACCASSSNASITVQSWLLENGVSYANGQQFSFSNVVQNPYHDTLTASGPGPSTATTEFDFSWTSTFGDFLLQASHRAADVDPLSLRSISEGRIYVTTNTDVLFTVDSSYTYSLPVNPMYTVFLLTVSDIQPPHKGPFGDAHFYDTSAGAPATGTFHINGQAILPAGHTWSILYRMQVEAFYGYTGQIAQGDGYIHFTLQEIPEPAAFAPLALTALLRRRRNPRRPR